MPLASQLKKPPPEPAKGRPAGVEDIDQRAFADVEAEEIAQHMAQPRQWNALNRAQINYQGAQVRPERRARLQSFGWRRFKRLRTIRADAAMQADARHVWFYFGNLDAVVDLTRTLLDARHIGAAALACDGEDIAFRSRIGMQRTMRPGVRPGLGFGRAGLGGLLSARGRHTGIIWRLRRQAKFFFQIANALGQNRNLLCEPFDLLPQQHDRLGLR